MPRLGNTDGSPEKPTPSRRRSRPAKALISRKKACEECSITKARCDLKRPHCSRCESRQINCDYTSSHKPPALADGHGEAAVAGAHNPPQCPTNGCPIGLNNEIAVDGNGFGFISSALTNFAVHNKSPSSPHTLIFPPRLDQQIPGESPLVLQETQSLRIENASVNPYWPREVVDFSTLDLICPIDAIKIRNRWLGDFIPSFDQRPKNYPLGISLFISRVLKIYPAMLLREGQLPPFIHSAQLSGSEIPTPLANCISLVRMWDGQVRGSEGMMRDIMNKEMAKLYEERASYGQMNRLAAFQAYMIYAMVLFFADGYPEHLIDRQVMINLQDLACDVASSGLVCPGELSHTRPDWESWIVASTKRRSLYTMYMFDNIFCSQNGLPTFLGEELQGLLAPASRTLWEATSRAAWKSEYNNYLYDWANGGLRIDELWPPPETGAKERRKRVDKWLTSVDEFGMMLFAITTVTHGE